jgi:transcriptional regulator with XRE-family HTH domain
MSESVSSTELSRRFGRWLKEQRKARGLTQEFVAEKSDITVTQLSRIENGKSGTRRDTVIQLAQIIGIDEAKALRHFAPESFAPLPEELENISFSEFTKHELREIADFINFKLAQKRAAQQGETKESGNVQPYRVKNGKLISDAETKENGHTNQKPPENES